MATVTVYQYVGFDIYAGEVKRFPTYATLECIKRQGFTTPVHQTSKEVDISSLDGDGRYIDSGGIPR